MKSRLTISIKQDLETKLKNYCEEKNIKYSNVIENLIAEYLNEKENKK